MNIKIRGAKRNEMHTVSLNGNTMTGDTYPVKDFIKSKLNGKWNAEGKAWTVDTNEVAYWLGKGAIYQASDEPQGRTEHHTTALCPYCHTYCEGDCRSH